MIDKDFENFDEFNIDEFLAHGEAELEMKPETSKKLTRSEHDANEKRIYRLAAPFFIVMAILTVIAFIIPLRPTVSVEEKRNLTVFPEFSVETLLDGTYFDDITLWFSDTFPGRTAWMSVADSVEGYYGYGDIVIYGEFSGGDAIPTVTEKPESDDEVEIEPSPTPEAQETIPPTPEVVETSPPEESVEEWGGINVDDGAEVVFGDVLQIGDTAFAYYGFSQWGADEHVEIVEDFAAIVAEYGVEVYDILVPTSVGVMVSSEDMEKINCSDQGAAISYIFSSMDDSVNKVNVFNTLISHNDEYLYFRTDHHWTALGAYYAYEEFCAVAGFEPVSLDEYDEWVLEGFRGSFYYTCTYSSKLLDDVVYAYDPPGDLEVKITAQAGNTFPWTVLTDMSAADASSKYMVFLAGDNPLTVITNNDLDDDAGNCVLIKDSFGNPFAPYLTQHYKNVYVVDYRYYSDMTMKYFVQYYDIDDVIILESLAMAQASGALDLVGYLCG